MGNFDNMPGGRAQFSISPTPKNYLKQDEFLLMTMRSHDQFNTTIYGMDDRYRGVYGERRVIFMNPEDIKEKGFHKEQVVNLVSCYDNQERRAKNFKIIPYDIPKSNLGAYFPETNVLVPINQYADKSNTPISKSVIVKIEIK